MKSQQTTNLAPINPEFVQHLTNISFYEFTTQQSFLIHQVAAYSLLFIDYGELTIEIDAHSYQLKEGETFLIPTKTRYTLATKESAVNVLLISFTSLNQSILPLIYQKPIQIDVSLRQLFAKIIHEAKALFPQITKNIFLVGDGQLEGAPVGADLLIALYLAQILIFMARTKQPVLIEKKKPSPTLIKKYFGKKEIDEMIDYMEANLDKNLSINQFADHFFVSPSYIKKTFKKETGFSLINFYRILKMERAKQWMREEEMNFTEISCLLGYETLHHFSNSFKKYTGLSPTAYKNSIQSIETKLDTFH